jgi:hypothetical protein
MCVHRAYRTTSLLPAVADADPPPRAGMTLSEVLPSHGSRPSRALHRLKIGMHAPHVVPRRAPGLKPCRACSWSFRRI